MWFDNKNADVSLFFFLKCVDLVPNLNHFEKKNIKVRNFLKVSCPICVITKGFYSFKKGNTSTYHLKLTTISVFDRLFRAHRYYFDIDKV